MFQFIFYLIITIGIIHFTLYYFNFDFDFNDLNYFKTRPTSQLDESNSNKSENLTIFSKNATNIELTLNDSINELKTLNECINNGEINTSFS